MEICYGYFLSCSCVSGDILMLLLLEAIEKVNNAGFIVKIVICDQGSNNQND